MGSASVGAIRIMDSDGDIVESDGSGRLKVAIDDIQVADINVHLTNATDDVLIYGYDYSSANQKLKVDNSGLLYIKSIADDTDVVLKDSTGTSLFVVDSAATLNLHNQRALTTNSILHARDTSTTTAPITCEDNTHNALHVSISDGAEIANVTSSNELVVDVSNVTGTDGDTGPSKSLSIAGTESGGALQEILVDASGKLQVDIVSASTLTVNAHAVTNAGTFAVQTDHAITGMTHAVHVVGTAAANLSSAACKRVDFMGNPSNAGDIYIGSADTIAGGGGVGGIRIQAGDFYSIDIDNVDEIWIEASEASQVLNYIYYT